MFLITSSYIYTQEIPNNSFEKWFTATEGHEDSENWSTANSTINTFLINDVTTEKTEDAYYCSYAAKLNPSERSGIL
ncbi:MAG: hypothetical protein PHP52_01815 [Bacteroidales bacterium]|nr:hypothetical protein [Bacteroidales bacterium]MDD4218093.1 hypothetical protein [Bacteroidales bacterium]MDY0141749.1 hypothetical protein [Bacteroidales bacterium]